MLLRDRTFLTAMHLSLFRRTCDPIPTDADRIIGRFELTVDTQDDLNEEVFYLVTNNGWSLNELYRKTINLEDVFLDLTTREET